jgi:hypothetical protein
MTALRFRALYLLRIEPNASQAGWMKSVLRLLAAFPRALARHRTGVRSRAGRPSRRIGVPPGPRRILPSPYLHGIVRLLDRIPSHNGSWTPEPAVWVTVHPLLQAGGHGSAMFLTGTIGKRLGRIRRMYPVPCYCASARPVGAGGLR